MSDDDDQVQCGHSDKYEGMGCLVICIAIALLIAAGPIIKIIEAVKQ